MSEKEQVPLTPAADDTAPEIRLPISADATDVIPDEVPGRSGPGGEK